MPPTAPPPSQAAMYAYPPGYPSNAPQYGGATGAGAPVWVDASGGQVPPGAVQGGQDVSGEPLFVIRASHEGGMIPGKLVPSHGCAYIPWGGKENAKPQYQVLILIKEYDVNKYVPTVFLDWRIYL